MAKLTETYIQDRLQRVHTYESFARTIVYDVLADAKSRVKGGKENFKSVLAITISPIVTPQRECVQVCAETPRGIVCVHVDF